MVIKDQLIAEGGWIERRGISTYNLYRPPTIKPGNKNDVRMWLDHAEKIFGDYPGHIINWFAHRVQRPQIKINHALVLGGAPGIGKDTLIEPVKRAIGPWNFAEVTPQQLLGRFNGFLKSVILRVSEVRDLGDFDRYEFYEHCKPITAAPPDVLRVDEKNLREHAVLNCCGLIFTSNYKTNGIYLPADDRRHFVLWSDCTKEDFDQDYWNRMWRWYDSGGDRNVAAYLAALDLSAFDPKAPPFKTPAFWAIVNANRAPEDSEMADTLDRMGNPDATTLERVRTSALGEFALWLTDRKNRRTIPHRFESCGYIPVHNEDAKDGQWRIQSTRQTVYAKKTLSLRDQVTAARRLAGEPEAPPWK
jgi:hypothetical protein